MKKVLICVVFGLIGCSSISEESKNPWPDCPLEEEVTRKELHGLLNIKAHYLRDKALLYYTFSTLTKDRELERHWFGSGRTKIFLTVPKDKEPWAEILQCSVWHYRKFKTMRRTRHTVTEYRLYIHDIKEIEGY